MEQKGIYLVGGAVRDTLLGLDAKDKDYCVVGASVAEMLEQGFKSVGKDFPVFLHPKTGEEYALARTERKNGTGYHGFDLNVANTVTLEEDLARRDLTINAMAMDETGKLFDPYGGFGDLKAGVLRHVSDAFKEDPVRILRIARFAARYQDFKIADETIDLMRSMVSAGEIDHLVAERVWQEFAKGMMESKPSRMFNVLRECGALKRLMPELDRLSGVIQPLVHHPEIDTYVHVMMVLDVAASNGCPIEVRFAAIMHDLGKGLTPTEMLPSHNGHEDAGVRLVMDVCERLRVPADCKELAILVTKYHTHVHRAQELRIGTLVKLLKEVDGFRRPERFANFLRACAMDARGRKGFLDRDYPQEQYMAKALAAAKAVDVGTIATGVKDKSLIPEQILAARIRAVKICFSDLVTE
jgi:tRNA nucleotidyltransferase (CCA-adding enzyme)